MPYKTNFPLIMQWNKPVLILLKCFNQHENLTMDTAKYFCGCRTQYCSGTTLKAPLEYIIVSISKLYSCVIYNYNKVIACYLGFILIELNYVSISCYNVKYSTSTRTQRERLQTEVPTPQTLYQRNCFGNFVSENEKKKQCLDALNFLLQENAALCDRASDMQHQIIIAQEERKFLWKKFMSTQGNSFTG